MNSIKRFREKLGLTQEELAEKLGVSSSGIVSMWENGIRTPRVPMLRTMAELFGCTVDELLKED